MRALYNILGFFLFLSLSIYISYTYIPSVLPYISDILQNIVYSGILLLLVAMSESFDDMQPSFCEVAIVGFVFVSCPKHH